MALRIDVVSDVICPWGFLGKRRLDKALSLIPDVDVEVIFRPFFLDPSIPPEGLDRHAYMAAKFGEERLKTIHDPLVAAGAAEGVPYRFDLITRTPNTLNAHRLLRLAQPAGVQPSVAEALFMAYWHHGQDVGDTEVLTTIAVINGFKAEQIRDYLGSDTDVEKVMAEVTQAQEIGVTGVPTFILGSRYGVVGAQSPEYLAQSIRKAAAG